MSVQRNANVGAAYDFIASDYDALMEPDMRMRRALWRHYERVFRAGDSVLDFGCGTGIDAMHLAGLGLSLTGVDASAGMIAQLRRKASAQGLAVESHVGALEDLGRFASGSFSGITSAFAALNTVPDLSVFALEAHRLLRPGGRLVGHFLAAPGAWEIFEYLAKGRWADALARRQCRETTIAVCGEPVTHLMLPPRETYDRFFCERFTLRRLYGVGFLWPQGWDGLVPAGVSSIGNRVESVVGRYPPFANWGRFFVLDLERR